MTSDYEHQSSAASGLKFDPSVAAGLVLFAVGALAAVAWGGHAWATALRWAGLLALAGAGRQKKSLTYWIFFSMILGGEIGFDRPSTAEHLSLLSDIFLRLIKVIVAPLIFGTLVTGIAGHEDLREIAHLF